MLTIKIRLFGLVMILQVRARSIFEFSNWGLMSSSSHIRRVKISGKSRSFRQTLDVYLLFFFS
jgi:hypothetical protein